MPIKLNGSTSGYSQLQAAAVAASNTLTLPASNGALVAQSTTTAPTNGQIPIGNGTDYTAATITQGTGITVTNGAGTITIANSGGTVTSITAGLGLTGGTITSSGTIAMTTTAGAVGTTIMAFNSSGSNIDWGGTVAGSSIRACAANGASQSATIPSGTWQCMGFASSAGGTSGVSAFIRTV
jgi:hypothetical protein